MLNKFKFGTAFALYSRKFDKLPCLYYIHVFSETINPETITMPEEWTDNGELCRTKCKKDGEAYNWCWKVGKSWDYCTPGKFHFIFFPF